MIERKNADQEADKALKGTGDEAVKEAIGNLAKSFKDFQEKNNDRLKEIEKKGAADPVLEATVKKLGDRLDEAQKELAAAQKKQGDLETAFQRKGSVSEKDSADLEAKAAQFSLEIGSPVNVDGLKAYNAAMNHYIRRNMKGASAEEVKALSVGSDPDGGYLVNPDMGGRIIKKVYETSPVRQIANVVTISTDALEGINDLNEAGSGWVGETESRSETTTPEVGEYRIPVHEQYAEPRATQKMLDDASVNVEEWLAGKVADKLAREENEAFTVGTGIKMPKGFAAYTTAATADATRAWGVLEHIKTGTNGGFGTAPNGSDKMIDLVYALKNAYRQGAVWAMKRAVLAEVRKLKDGDGNYLWQPDFGQRQGGLILGFGVAELEDMAALATDSLSVAFGNFKEGYQIVDRAGIRVLRDPFTAKPYVKFYTTKRVGGDVVNFEAIKFLKFAA